MDRVQYCVLEFCSWLPVFIITRSAGDRCTAEFRLVGYFENLVSKIGMTQNISPSFRSSHSTSLGDASPTTVRSISRKPGRLRRADKAADWSDIATRKYCFCGGPPPMCSSRAVIFQTFAIRPNMLTSEC